ncbi:unnamed protein product [Pocillopora meandrina]|uniref:C2H2-type domain-containing protein n=1 Tax=Pocillopora meandrina TaxID=46732 RepID=A0AAU9XK67_9CNID|nr:unnamed protein product [Pocillopora meandrina]
MSCSFLNIVGGICGADERTSSSTSVTPLTRCNRDIKNHKKSLKFSGIETEVELILARCGCFQKPANLSDMTICPVHRAKLGLGWRRTGNLCTILEVVSGHCKELRKAPALEKGINLFQSMKIFELSKQLVPVGSGICVKCRKMLSVYKERAPEKCQMTAEVSEIAETLNKLNLVHVVESSSIADHCRTYALSDSTDSDFQGHCSHSHNETYAQCCQLQEVLSILETIQLKTAIESGPGSCAKASYVTFNPSSTRHVKWDGVSLLNNFKYEENGIRAWREFNVGPGKLLTWSQFEGVLQVPETLEVVDPPSQKLSTKPSFKKVRHRHVNKKSASDPNAASDANSREQEDDDGENEQASPLFPCPEEGCIKAYSRFVSLQAHLDTGKHKRLPEQETLYDKAKRGYASKLMDEGSRISTVQLQCEEQNSQCFSPLTMGWALKTITKKTRFTQKQNEFLKQQFEIGEQSGRKADPNEVSKMMRSSRDELGARRFLPEEVLAGQQITGFFSRLAAKKRLPPSTVNREESDEETTREDDRASQEQVIQSEICAQVMREVSLQHPIVSSSGYNICELMRMGKKKLMSLSVDMLHSICNELGVDVSDITQRRKNPFISRLSKLVGECGCTS